MLTLLKSKKKTYRFKTKITFLMILLEFRENLLIIV
jgi:hypothetical protein